MGGTDLHVDQEPLYCSRGAPPEVSMGGTDLYLSGTPLEVGMGGTDLYLSGAPLELGMGGTDLNVDQEPLQRWEWVVQTSIYQELL
ncbi:hypothetical protein BaRGS_00035562 [Batillaria attramentaria]|uniref:Uncharacterized protein n=1 Tax=Batillaria attramentaria TaxID=370345 RepID=A0ABD0JE32_9CAEN